MKIGKLLFDTTILMKEFGILKNNKQIIKCPRTKRPRLIMSKKSSIAKSYIMNHLQLEKNKKSISSSIDFPVAVSFKFYFTERNYYTQKNTIKKTMGDLSNLYQLPEDCLEKVGILENDSWIFSHYDSGKYLTTKDINYLEIKIFEIKN